MESKHRIHILYVILAVAACSGSGGGPQDAGRDDGGGQGVSAAACLSDPDCGVPFACAHRGIGGGGPENTLAAFLGCEAQGVPMLEIDTRETADGVIVVMHDDTVDRTTDGESRYPGRTAVDQLTREEFADLVIDDEACAADPDADPDRCHPPTLRAVIERTGQDTVLDIDFKEGDPARLAALVEETGATGRVLLFDSDLDVLRAYRAALPGGLVMPRASNADDLFALLETEQDTLGLLWVHGDPFFIGEVADAIQAAGVRLYVNGWDEPVDVNLGAAALSEDPEQKAAFEAEAWEVLDAMIEAGAGGFGTNYAPRYVEHLYPGGFGNP